MRRCHRPSDRGILSGFCLVYPLVSDKRDKTQEDAGLRPVSVVKGKVGPKITPSPQQGPSVEPTAVCLGSDGAGAGSPEPPRSTHRPGAAPGLLGGAPPLTASVPPGVDVEAAKRAEEELLLQDTRRWLNGGAMPEARHPRTGASALHVAAAKGYIEVMR